MKRDSWHFNQGVMRYVATASVVGFCYFGFVTVLLNLLLLRLEYGTSFIGLVNGTTAIAFAVSSIPSGALGTRLGMKRVSLIGVFLLSIGVFLVPFIGIIIAPGSTRDVAIIISRLISGMGFSFYIVNAHPYVVAATSSNNRTNAFALLSAIPPVTGFIGSLLAGFLPTLLVEIFKLDSRDPVPIALVLIFAGICLLPTIWILKGVEEINPEQDKETPQQAESSNLNLNMKKKAFLIVLFFLCITAMFRNGGESVVRTFFNVYLEVELNQDINRIALLLAIGQLIGCPAALTAPILARHLSKENIISVTTFLTAGVVIILTLVPNWLVAGAAFGVIIALRALTWSIATIFSLEIVPLKWRGVTSGTVSMSQGIGFATLSIGGGQLIPIIGFTGIFWLSAIITVVGGIIFTAYFPGRKIKKP